MARPKKPDAERMVQFWTHLPPDVAAVIERAAESNQTHVSIVLRKLVLAGFQTLKTRPAESSLTL